MVGRVDHRHCWASVGELDAKAGHPWLVCGPAFASRVGKLTGVPVRTR